MEIKLHTQQPPPARAEKPKPSQASRQEPPDETPPPDQDSSVVSLKGEEDDSMAARLRQAMEDIQEKYKMKVELDRDEETGRQVVRILSQDGERLVRQIPPQEALEMASRAWDDIRSHIVTWRG